MHKILTRTAGRSALFASVFLTAAGVAHAAVIPDIAPTGHAETFNNSAQAKNYVDRLVTGILNVVGFIAGAIALLYLIWMGIRYITAGGDTKKAEEARTGILHAVIGIIIIIAAYTIINLALGAGHVISNPTGFRNQ